MTKVFLGFKECEPHLSGVSTCVTGTPVRESLRKINSHDAAKILGLDTGRKTLAVIGGSQGAHGLNAKMLEIAPLLDDEWKFWQVVHITGAKDAEEAAQVYRKLGILAKVMPFCDEMEVVYSVADLVVARSGAASLAEISMYGLPSLLIPYPNAANDHQARNADIFVAHEAAKCLDERAVTSRDFERELRILMKDNEGRRQMGEKAKNLLMADAAERIAKEVEYEIA
jgi:UDP-N-acetylglucosamine--N-acetylmuramyl-(pentapeptide) pyrophosphoryl-undecaprenol N-acetylglucosamine transferase